MITRRQFLKASAATGIVAGVGGFVSPRSAHAYYQSPQIPLFATTLRGAGGIPVAAADLTVAPVTGVKHYTIDIAQFQDQIAPTLGPTTLWGYQPTRFLVGGPQQRHLGGIIVAQRDEPIQITFRNKLFVNKHIIPVDTTIAGANQAVNRTAVHLHGGLVPWISDGGPFDWWGPLGNRGTSFLNNKTLNPFAPFGSAEYYWPMKQSARFMWYHDHAIGITRLNAYAGVATGLLLRDTYEAALVGDGLPNYLELGGNEIPLVFQEKTFVGSNIKAADPTWASCNLQTVTQNPGSLWYAHTYEPGRWALEPGGLALPHPSCIPEFFGDTMLVNGTVYPHATVQARRYRLRILNATNARWLNLQLYVADGSANGITLDINPVSPTYGQPTNTAFVNAATTDSSFLQIGTEGGFLAKPAKVPCNVPISIPPPDATGVTIDPSLILHSLLVAPAERPDVIVDFTGYAGQSLILYTDAPAPFPGGDDLNDYFPGWNAAGNPVNGTTAAGFGPNTRILMRFDVVAASGAPDLPLTITTATDLTAGNDPLFVTPPDLGVPPPADVTRFLTLNEASDAYGRLIQILGNAAEPYGSPYDGTADYLGYPPGISVTKGHTEESVLSGDTEVWEIYNTTGDVHPMHFHLVNVQIVNRQNVDVRVGPPYVATGPVIPPEPNEQGWKETVMMFPGTVTRVVMKFDLTNAQIVTSPAKGSRTIPTPASPRTGGMEYVWHCHILEHEEHDMMHALVVT
jgi:spore coat protein A